MDKLSPIQVQQMFEQLEAHLLSQATILASFYAKLLEEKVPEELAVLLTVELHETMLNTLLFFHDDNQGM